MTERSCNTCRYGDNGSEPENCSECNLAPDLPDWEPRDQYLWPVTKPVDEKDGEL